MTANSRRREITVELVVGTFMFCVLLGLCIFTIVLTRVNLFAKHYPLEVVFDDVMGLRDGDNVVIRGMSVGKVKRLLLQPDGVHILAEIDRMVALKQDYTMEIGATSVLGGRYLQIHEGSLQAPPLPTGTALKGVRPHDLITEASAVVGKIRDAIDNENILGNLSGAIADIKEITGKINEGEGSLGKLVNDESLYDDAKATMANLNAVSEKIQKGEGTLGKLVNDDTLYNDARDIVAEVKTAVKERQLLAKLETTVANLDAITEKINSGQGTLGKLVNDDAVYQEVKKLVGEARATLDDLRETSPVVTFTSIFLGAF
ncbi:MAG: MCE family protein [Lentisphaerae bacterium]|nr:MCE family protein [Lentisphaerota bacterium]